MDNQNAESSGGDTNGRALRSLAPEYRPEHHGASVERLRAALDDPSVRNIAVTGVYGAGKSSILLGLSREYPTRVLNLSLSSVGADEELPTGPSGNPAAQTKTNRIQKEIVKQILYRDDPWRTRASRFRRISRFRLRRELGVAALGGLLMLAVLYVTRLSQPLVAFGKPSGLAIAGAYALLFVVLAAVVLSIRWVIHGRFVFDTLAAGGATVKLAQDATSYFDQFTDEIVYFFEQSGRDIVIFEDIDRFDDIHIFETLRALNTLLNASYQVRHRRRPGWRRRRGPVPDVKFIYALQDSAFAQLKAATGSDEGRDSAEEELKRANRTKFFELVVTVVPFITHRNARDLMSKEMEGTGVSEALIDTAAPHVTDMRLMVNMRNEYDVYASSLLNTPNQMPGLDPDRLFALILYKNTQAKDFEDIRLGCSKLDILHEAWRKLVAASINEARERQREAVDSLARSETTERRAQLFGQRIDEFALATINNPQPRSHSFTINGRARSSDEIRTPAFWTEFSKAPTNISIHTPNSGGLTLNPRQLRVLLQDELDPAQWEPIDRQEQINAREQARRDIDFLRHHNWEQIYAQPRFAADIGGNKTESFAQATSRLLRFDYNDSPLARDLVAHGYINDYFSLYISTYYGGHLRRDALNYIVHSIDPGTPDPHYPLEPADVDAILHDKGLSVLQDRAAYNIAILDHLLASNGANAQSLVKQVSTWDQDAQNFAGLYISQGSHPVDFVRVLAPLLPELVEFTLRDAPVSRQARITLVDAALANQKHDLGYVDGLAAFAIENYESFESLVSSDATARQAESTIKALANVAVELPDTRRLNKSARAATIEHNTYAITETNLQLLAGVDSVALDVLLAQNKAVYDRALGSLSKYLDAIDGSIATPFSVSGGADFAAILNDADAAATPHGEPSLAMLVERAAPDCTVPELTAVPPRLWPALMAGRRCDLSAMNLLEYLTEFGHLDAPVAVLIADNESVPETATLTEADRTRLALAIVNAGESIPSPSQRVTLAQSLVTASPFTPNDITPERGELVGRLITAELLADDEVTFASGLLPDWPTREYAISTSSRFAGFVSPAVLPNADLPAFFASSVVRDALKREVVQQLEYFTSDAELLAGRPIARYAAGSNIELNLPNLQMLKNSGAAADDLAGLLTASAGIAPEQLRDFLRSLGGVYATLADPGASRPLVDNTPANRKLLARLKEIGIVSETKPEKGRIRVSLRHTEPPR